MCFRLTIEETDEEGMVYQSAMSDILKGDKVSLSVEKWSWLITAATCIYIVNL
jgi:hypothetical protein